MYKNRDSHLSSDLDYMGISPSRITGVFSVASHKFHYCIQYVVRELVMRAKNKCHSKSTVLAESSSLYRFKCDIPGKRTCICNVHQ